MTNNTSEATEDRTERALGELWTCSLFKEKIFAKFSEVLQKAASHPTQVSSGRNHSLVTRVQLTNSAPELFCSNPLTVLAFIISSGRVRLCRVTLCYILFKSESLGMSPHQVQNKQHHACFCSTHLAN